MDWLFKKIRQRGLTLHPASRQPTHSSKKQLRLTNYIPSSTIQLPSFMRHAVIQVQFVKKNIFSVRFRYLVLSFNLIFLSRYIYFFALN